MKLIRPLLFIVCAVSSITLLAQDDAKKSSPLRLLLGGALEFGGDAVSTVYFTNGDTQSVNAGQGISIAVGAEFQTPGLESLLFHGTVGYKYVTTQADNVHIRLTRVPIILTANWRIAEKFRLGAGLASHQSIKFNADGLGENISFKPASGPIFEFAYRGIGISYTIMEYQDTTIGEKFSANSFGITFSGVIPKR